MWSQHFLQVLDLFLDFLSLSQQTCCRLNARKHTQRFCVFVGTLIQFMHSFTVRSTCPAGVSTSSRSQSSSSQRYSRLFRDKQTESAIKTDRERRWVPVPLLRSSSSALVTARLRSSSSTSLWILSLFAAREADMSVDRHREGCIILSRQTS